MLSAAEWHNKHHRLKDGSLSKESTCRKCVIAKARCAGKIEYKSRACADKAALRENIERRWWPGACMLAYRCRYCCMWHLTTACRTWQTRRVEKMYERWLRKTGQKRRYVDEWREVGRWDDLSDSA